MDSVIKDALKLKRSALKTLAEKNANRVYSVSYILLGDINLAKKATAFVFKDIEGLLVGEKIETEKDFSEACTKKAVDYCKTITLKKDAKAYRIPENRDFSLSPSAECDGVGNCYEYVFGKFSPLQKLIFVSFSVLEQGEKETARVTKLDKKTLSLALDAEGQNAIRLLASIGRSEDASYTSRIISSIKNDALGRKITSENKDDTKDARIILSIFGCSRANAETSNRIKKSTKLLSKIKTSTYTVTISSPSDIMSIYQTNCILCQKIRYKKILNRSFLLRI